MNKVMITGSSGLLGRAIYTEFSNCSWNVLGLANSRAKGNLVKLNLHDFTAVKIKVHDFKPDVIIHCAAERSPDKVEKDNATSFALNVNCSKYLAELAREINAAFLYISTDYVFDGRYPPYKESDAPNPINQYGRSKWEGEKAVMEANPDSCILRIPVLYGDEEYIGESAVSSLLKSLLNDKPAFVSNYEIRFPACTSDIAKICYQLMEIKLKNPYINSIFHYCGEEALTKYQMTMVLADLFFLPHFHIAPVNIPPADTTCPRPLNTQLCCDRLMKLGICKYTYFHEGIKCYKKFLETDF